MLLFEVSQEIELTEGWLSILPLTLLGEEVFGENERDEFSVRDCDS